MPNTGTGLDAQLGVAKETTYGTAVTPARFVEFTSETMARGKVTVQGGGLRAGGQYARGARRVITTHDAKGNVVFDAVNTGMGIWLQAALGASTITNGSSSTLAAAASASATTVSVTGAVVAGQQLLIDTGGAQETRTAISVTGSGPYAVTVAALSNSHSSGAAVVIGGGAGAYTQTHTAAGLRGNSLTVQVGKPTASGTVEPFTYVGCKVSDLDITIAKGGLAVFTVSLDAQDEQTLGSTPAGPALAVASYAGTAAPFSFLSSSLLLNNTAVAAVTNANVKVTNPLKSDRYYLGAGGLKAEPLTNNWKTITGTLAAEFTTRAALYDSFASDASLSLSLSFTGPTITGTSTPALLQVILPLIKLNGESPKVSGPDLLGISCPYVGLDDGQTFPIQVNYVSGDTAV